MSQDAAAAVAFDPSAPSDERTAALSELQQTHMPTSSELLNQAHIGELVEHVNGMYADLALEQQLAKSMNDSQVPFPSRSLREGKPGMHSVQLDELTVSVAGDWLERPGLLGFDSMRSMVEQTPVLGSVINTRVRQVQRFCRVAESGELPGFEIRHIDREHQLTTGERDEKLTLQKFVANCGFESNALRRKVLRRDNFKGFMSKHVRDSLTMDSAGIELEWKRDRSLGIDGFYAVDGSTIRLCSENGYQGDDEIFALQVVNGRICTAYSHMDLIYEPRNPRTDVRACGYGLAEVETLIRVVTGFLNAMTYNSKGFDSNSIPKGILTLIGNYQQSDIAAFKRMWNAQVLGVQNSWKLPVMVSKEKDASAQFTGLGNEFNEMHFSKWMTFLTSIICAIYGMSPAEINFDAFSSGNTSALGGSDTAEKLAASKDSGLYPLLTHCGDLMSDFIVSQFGDQWCFRWTGLEPDDADKRHELKKAVSTQNEVRAELGMVEHPEPLIGGAPLDSTAMGLYQQLKQSEIGPPPDMGGEPGAPGAAGGPETPGAAEGADFGADSSGPGAGSFGDEGDEGFGHAKTGSFGKSPGETDFGGGKGAGADFGKAMPIIYEVAL